MQGHIHRRVHTSNDGRTTTTWYVVVDRGRDRNGKRRQKWHGGFRTRREAEAARAKIVTDINSGTYIAPSSTTFESYIRSEWLPTMKSRLKPTTYDSYSRNLELHVLPELGGLTLQALTASKLNALYGDLLRHGRRKGNGGGLSARTVSYVHRIVHKALADAVESQLIAQNPATRARPPRATRSEAEPLHFWTPQELGQFLEAMRDTSWYALWHVAAMTGMRRGELLGLRWNDIDFEHSRLSVRRAFVSVSYEVHTTTPKNRRARVVDLDPATLIILRNHKIAGSNDGLVFTTPEGAAIHPDRMSKVFEQEVKRSGLPRIRLHDLRHTHATIALRAGVPVKVISERLGHESPAFTLRQYAHVLPGMQAEAAATIAAEVLTKPFGDVPVSPPCEHAFVDDNGGVQ